MKVKIIQAILTKNPCYTAGRKIKVKGLMLHSVGCAQPSAQVFIKNWNRADYDKACVHGFIDANTGEVYQTLPWDHRGWHGGGSSNNTHIGVEMCEPACLKYTGGAKFTCSNLQAAREDVKRTYESAVGLFAERCIEFSLDPLADGVIVSHAEGYKRGIASGHADPEHLWTQLGMSYTMDGFRRDVKAAMGGAATTGGTAATPSTAKPAAAGSMTEKEMWDKLKSFGLSDYAAAAAMAHFFAESGLKPNNLQNSFNTKLGMTDEEYTAAVDSGKYQNFVRDSAGYGFVQWTYWSRKQALLNFAKSKGKSIGDPTMQLEFFWQEIQGYKAVMDVLKKAGTVKEASDAILHGYEKPADQSAAAENRRAAYGQGYFAKYANAAPAQTPPAQPTAQPKLPYKVKVKITDLNIRKGPGTSYGKNGCTGAGVFTIVEEKDGPGADKWGRLKSGAGWIALDFCQRI